MSDNAADAVGARVRAEAAAWFARMRGPEGPGLTDELAAWRSADPANDMAYARMLQRWDQSAFLTNSALGRGRDLGLATHRPLSPALRYLAGAAAFAVLALVGVFALDRSRSFVDPVAAATTVASARGELRTVRLDDGSRVTLDAGSAIDVAFTATERRLRLDHGRVRIDAADAARPFVVAVPGGAIFARRSLFDVAVGQSGVEVALLRGALDVAPDGAGAGARRPVPLGHYVLLLPTGNLAQPVASSATQLQWTKGMVAFDGDRLTDAAAATNPHNARRIVLGSPGLADLRITGAFHAADPDGFADAVATTFGLTVTRAPDGSIVLRKKIVG